jgi:putative transcriptional regulator
LTIKELRALTGLSQAKFGEKYKIPRRTIQNWEADVNTPPQYVVDLLERAVKEDTK